MNPRFKTFLIDAALVLGAITVGLWVFSLFEGSEVAVGPVVCRNQGVTTVPLATPEADSLTSGFQNTIARGLQGPKPKNLILFIGDGMGVGTVSAASALLTPPGVPLAMEGAPFIGLMHTWCSDFLVPDSAAAGTALATGFKTDRELIGMIPDGTPVRNLFEAARQRALRTGLITTSGLADATPGAFLAHASSRYHYDRVLRGALESGADVLIGGDYSGKPKAWNQPPYRHLVEEVEEFAGGLGYTVIREPESLPTSSAPLLALFPPRADMPIQHGPPLAKSTARAIELMAGGPHGFLLVVESEVIDEAAHNNDITETMAGVREFDDAVAWVLEWAATRDETLVLVLADHETGGPHLLHGGFSTERVTVRWAHDYHSSQMVPVFAFGPGAEHFSGVFDNTDVAPRIAALLDLEGFPSVAEFQQN